MINNIISAVIGFLARLIYDKISERHPKVVFNVEPIRGFNLPSPNAGQSNLQIWQHALHLANRGKTPATNIVLTHDYLPFQRNVSPHAINKTHIDEPNRIITIDLIAPGEGIDINYMDMHSYSTITLVTYDQGIARHIPLMVTIPPKRWFVITQWSLALVGAAFILYCFWFKVPELWQLTKALILKVKSLKQ